jgi:hypothetical protein
MFHFCFMYLKNTHDSHDGDYFYPRTHVVEVHFTMFNAEYLTLAFVIPKEDFFTNLVFRKLEYIFISKIYDPGTGPLLTLHA